LLGFFYWICLIIFLPGSFFSLNLFLSAIVFVLYLRVWFSVFIFGSYAWCFLWFLVSSCVVVVSFLWTGWIFLFVYWGLIILLFSLKCYWFECCLVCGFCGFFLFFVSLGIYGLVFFYFGLVCLSCWWLLVGGVFFGFWLFMVGLIGKNLVFGLYMWCWSFGLLIVGVGLDIIYVICWCFCCGVFFGVGLWMVVVDFGVAVVFCFWLLLLVLFFLWGIYFVTCCGLCVFFWNGIHWFGGLGFGLDFFGGWFCVVGGFFGVVFLFFWFFWFFVVVCVLLFSVGCWLCSVSLFWIGSFCAFFCVCLEVVFWFCACLILFFLAGSFWWLMVVFGVLLLVCFL